jgi:hypothetical protein
VNSSAQSSVSLGLAAWYLVRQAMLAQAAGQHCFDCTDEAGHAVGRSQDWVDEPARL